MEVGDSPENQLELFDLSKPSLPKPRKETLGQILLRLRYDQLVLMVMGSIIGITVIFACGVERGKQLARTERHLMLARQQPEAASLNESAPLKRGVAPEKEAATVLSNPTATKVESKQQEELQTEPKAEKEEPKKQPALRSRYAVQIVTYTRPQLAKKELDRLRAGGESAFLVMRDGRTILYVGPFPSKGNASEKVAELKTRYKDCFVRTL